MIQDITNTLYEMDNLEVLRGINSNSIDLIATDPPFNTKRNRSSSAGFYVDKWKYFVKRIQEASHQYNLDGI